MLTVTRQQVLGALKATGSSDADVLFAAKEAVVTIPRHLRLVALAPLVLGTLLTITVLGAIPGIPLLIMGWWLRRHATRNLAEADAVYREYLGSLGGQPPATDGAGAPRAVTAGGLHALR